MEVTKIALEASTDPSQVLRRRRLTGSVVVIGISAVFAGWIGLGVGGAATVRDFDDVVTALAALTAAVLCLRASATQHDRLRRFWLLMGAASAAWTIAEVTWGVYDVVLRVPVPIPSWADVGYLSAIPLAAAALLSHPAMHEQNRHQARATLDGIVVATSLLFLSWTLVLGPLWRLSDMSSLGGIVDLAYPFGDVVMLFLVVLVMRSMKTGDRFALGCVLGGLVAMACADSTYAYLTEVGKYSTGNLVDTGWVVAYLALALGAYCSTGGATVRVARPVGSSSTLSLVVPFVPVIGALVASAIEVALGRKLLLTDWVMAVVLTVLVLARQGLFLFDEFGPPDRLPEHPVEPAFTGVPGSMSLQGAPLSQEPEL
jgi:hypothetical protein